VSELHDALVDVASFAATLRITALPESARPRTPAGVAHMAIDTALRQWIAMGAIVLAEPMPVADAGFTGEEWKAVE
jgi:hypothetical protein